MLEDGLKSAAEEVDKEMALKEVEKATIRQKGTAVAKAEEKTKIFERAQAVVEQKMTEMANKLKEIELKLARVESLNSAKDKEIAELKTVLEANENKWYNVGFADTENSVELVMFKSRWYGFSEGWMAALLAKGVPKDSPLKNPIHVPYPKPPPIQNHADAKDEETESMRELV